MLHYWIMSGYVLALLVFLLPPLLLVSVIAFLEVRRARRIRRGEPLEGLEVPAGGFEVTLDKTDTQRRPENSPV
jgi:hypothetical protein